MDACLGIGAEPRPSLGKLAALFKQIAAPISRLHLVRDDMG
jgi:hypothetical protein